MAIFNISKTFEHLNILICIDIDISLSCSLLFSLFRFAFVQKFPSSINININTKRNNNAQYFFGFFFHFVSVSNAFEALCTLCSQLLVRCVRCMYMTLFGSSLYLRVLFDCNKTKWKHLHKFLPQQ